MSIDIGWNTVRLHEPRQRQRLGSDRHARATDPDQPALDRGRHARHGTGCGGRVHVHLAAGAAGRSWWARSASRWKAIRASMSMRTARPTASPSRTSIDFFAATGSVVDAPRQRQRPEVRRLPQPAEHATAAIAPTTCRCARVCHNPNATDIAQRVAGSACVTTLGTDDVADRSQVHDPRDPLGRGGELHRLRLRQLARIPSPTLRYPGHAQQLRGLPQHTRRWRRGELLPRRSDPRAGDDGRCGRRSRQRDRRRRLEPEHGRSARRVTRAPRPRRTCCRTVAART